MVQLNLEIVLSQRLYPGKPMYLEVRTWNTRAVRCYEKAGFRVVGEPVKRVMLSGEGTFYHMVRQAQGSFRARC
jgi:ribosomal-protein-alanine N-acetyltransferase